MLHFPTLFQGLVSSKRASSSDKPGNFPHSRQSAAITAPANLTIVQLRRPIAYTCGSSRSSRQIHAWGTPGILTRINVCAAVEIPHCGDAIERYAVMLSGDAKMTSAKTGGRALTTLRV
jgi:hypothetical protein